MSYDVGLVDEHGDILISETPLMLKGGTYAIGGTNELWLNITYNYSEILADALERGNGIRSLYGKTGEESIPILERAIGKLGDDESDDYWEATEGNVKKVLQQLLFMAKLAPDGIWDGD